ncbi:MAG: redox-sensing transcriptional repressor Rex [Candidatus Neomarinimicrobiota bacterium]|nr:MAG: redox-sensing transcriptional repressor Rex [Candidatus Neomarinimicrobiota bacterium]
MSKTRVKPIPDETISRLFPYMRALICLLKEGTEVVSSNRLSEICNINAAIIRKDLSYFGEFGKRGIGYNVQNLLDTVRGILKMEDIKKVALIGVGNIGTAILSYPFFYSEGFKIVAAFDNDKEKIGKKIKGIIVEDINNAEKTIKAENIKICILAIPVSETCKVANMLANLGVNAILSFAPCQINMPENVEITNIDLSTELARLAYYSHIHSK